MDKSYFCPLVGDKIGYKYFTLNSNGSFNKMGTLLPDIGKDYSKIISANLFSYTIGINDAKNKIVFAYRYWDRLETFDFDTGKEITINGPEHKIPEFVVRGQNMALAAKGNINGYRSPCSGENGFFVLYSGEDLETARRNNTRNLFDKILYFDYSGKLLAYYKLDTQVCLITVDWDKRIVYGINNQLEPYLIEFNY